MLTAVGLSAQEAPKRDSDLPVVVRSSSHRANDWVPVVALWCRGDENRRKQLVAALVADGFAVANLDTVADPKALAGRLAKLRQQVRVDQGGLHAVVATDADAALRAVLGQRHEFQTVTVCGAAAEADLEAVRKLPKRRVDAVPGEDAAAVSAHVKKLHLQRARPGAVGDVHRVLDSFHDAAAVGDEDRYFRILPEDSVFLGTDATERWTGREFKGFAMRYFKLPSAWTYVPLERHVTLSADGTFAWFDEALDNASYGECRGTGVLRKRDGAWVILQYNLTVPVPNELMGGVAKKIRTFLDGRPAKKAPK